MRNWFKGLGVPVIRLTERQLQAERAQACIDFYEDVVDESIRLGLDFYTAMQKVLLDDYGITPDKLER